MCKMVFYACQGVIAWYRYVLSWCYLAVNELQRGYWECYPGVKECDLAVTEYYKNEIDFFIQY